MKRHMTDYGGLAILAKAIKNTFYFLCRSFLLMQVGSFELKKKMESKSFQRVEHLEALFGATRVVVKA